MGSSMASIGSLGSGRLRRATSEDCPWMTEVKSHFEEINAAIGNALEAINEIYPTGLSSLDTLLLEMKDFYGQLKTTYETIIDNLGASISGVCPDITTITKTESSTAATSTISEETMMSTEPTTTIAPITSTASSTPEAPPTTTMAPTTSDVPTTEA